MVVRARLLCRCLLCGSNLLCCRLNVCRKVCTSVPESTGRKSSATPFAMVGNSTGQQQGPTPQHHPDSSADVSLEHWVRPSNCKAGLMAAAGAHPPSLYSAMRNVSVLLCYKETQW